MDKSILTESQVALPSDADSSATNVRSQLVEGASAEALQKLSGQITESHDSNELDHPTSTDPTKLFQAEVDKIFRGMKEKMVKSDLRISFLPALISLFRKSYDHDPEIMSQLKEQYQQFRFHPSMITFINDFVLNNRKKEHFDSYRNRLTLTDMISVENRVINNEQDQSLIQLQMITPKCR